MTSQIEQTDVSTDVVTDVVVIGSGIGGLCCAALLAHYGLQVTVCESHSIIGGAAHGFTREGHHFDSGPSLYSGLSYSPSPNPLRQVLDIIEEDVTWANYDTWGCRLPEGDFDTTVGVDQFCEVLQTLRCFAFCSLGYLPVAPAPQKLRSCLPTGIGQVCSLIIQWVAQPHSLKH